MSLPAKQVFLLTGYHPDFEFIEGMGVHLDSETKRPAMDPETLGKQYSWIACGGSGGWRTAHRRNLH